MISEKTSIKRLTFDELKTMLGNMASRDTGQARSPHGSISTMRSRSRK